jgi:pentatricopeptide repeat protein
VLDMLQRARLKADCIFYTTLISACAKAGKMDLMFKVYFRCRSFLRSSLRGLSEHNYWFRVLYELKFYLGNGVSS